MRKCMGIGYRTTRTSRGCARRNSHHRTCLADMRTTRPRYSWMHLLNYSSCGWCTSWMMGWAHRMRREAWMLGDALMGSKRLRHHHFQGSGTKSAGDSFSVYMERMRKKKATKREQTSRSTRPVDCRRIVSSFLASESRNGKLSRRARRHSRQQEERREDVSSRSKRRNEV